MLEQRSGSRAEIEAGSLFAASLLLAATTVAGATHAGAAEPEQPFTPVVHDVLAGDLVMAGNSNLVSAGGFRPAAEAVADVDGDDTSLCVGRLYVPAACGENSSSATLDVPVGARVVAARLYVNTSLTSATGPIQVRLDGPAAGFEYTTLSAATPGIAKVRESAGRSSRSAAPMRQAVWDVTEYVRTAGAGSYTVADIMFERAGAYLPYAAWTIVAAYELDPAVDLAVLSPEQRARFAPRAVTWDDGFVTMSDGSVDVIVDRFVVPAGAAVFAKTFHLAVEPATAVGREPALRRPAVGQQRVARQRTGAGRRVHRDRSGVQQHDGRRQRLDLRARHARSRRRRPARTDSWRRRTAGRRAPARPSTST